MSADFGMASIKMAGSLILISGLIICLFYLLKRFRWNAFSGNKNTRMRILGMLQLATKRAIALVEICDQWLIVGVGTENLTLISKMEPPPIPCDSENGRAEDKKKFHSILHNLSPWQKAMGLRKDEKPKH